VNSAPVLIPSWIKCRPIMMVLGPGARFPRSPGALQQPVAGGEIIIIRIEWRPAELIALATLTACRCERGLRGVEPHDQSRGPRTVLRPEMQHDASGMIASIRSAEFVRRSRKRVRVFAFDVVAAERILPSSNWLWRVCRGHGKEQRAPR